MKKISVLNWISVDGLFAGAHGETHWFTPDEELEKDNLEELPQSDTLIMGRKTFEMMMNFWPTEQAKKQMPVIAEFMNHSSKHIFSRTISSSDWENSFFYSEISAKVINEIKEESKKNIVILGSGEVCKALQALQLIDRYILLIDPQILGNGSAFFNFYHPVKLKLDTHKVYPSGTVRLEYEVEYLQK